MAPLSIYLAARYGRRQELAAYARLLQAAGHRVTARWLTGVHDTSAGMSDEDAALEDLIDVERADVLISFTEEGDVPGRARGGRHVEFGWALARGKRLIVLGPRENIFHHHPRVEVVSGYVELLRVLARPRRWDPALKTIASTDLPVFTDDTIDACLRCGANPATCGHHQDRAGVQ